MLYTKEIEEFSGGDIPYMAVCEQGNDRPISCQIIDRKMRVIAHIDPHCVCADAAELTKLFAEILNQRALGKDVTTDRQAEIPAAVSLPLIDKIRELADELESCIDTHIYDGDEPANAPERIMVADARILADKAEAGTLPDRPDVRLRQAAQNLVLAAAAVQDGEDAGDSTAQNDEWSEALTDLGHATDAVSEALRSAPIVAAGAAVPVAVWLFLKDDGAASVFGTKAEADAAWRADAEKLWQENCKGKPPTDNRMLCEGLQAADCYDWGEVEGQTVNVSFPPAPAAESLALPPVAFAAIFEHKHGRTITIHATREQAEAVRQSVAAQFWQEEMKGEPPADTKELADAYFQYMSERGHEFFSIEECPVEATS
jgi:hypothetical protein